jgi:hypothetical protein
MGARRVKTTVGATVVAAIVLVALCAASTARAATTCPNQSGSGHALKISPCSGPLGTTFTATSIDPCPPPPDGSTPAVVGGISGPNGGGFTMATMKPDGSWTWSDTIKAPPPEPTPATAPPGGGIFGPALGPFTGVYRLSLACVPSQAFDKPYFTYDVQEFTVTTSATVTPQEVHKSDGIDDVPDPGQLDLSMSAIATSFGFAGLMILLLLLATRLIDSTLENNWETLRRWKLFRLLARNDPDAGFWSTPPGYVTFLAAATLLTAAWHPSLHRLGDAVFGVVIGTLVRSTLGLWFARRRYRGEYHGYLHARPGSLAIAAAALASSWLAGLDSPIIFGILAGAAFRPRLSHRRNGELTAFVSIASAGVAVAGWFLRWALHTHVSNPSHVVKLLENGLSVLLLAAIWGLALGMAPLRYFPGATVRAWKPAAWLTAWIVGMTFAVHVLLSDYGVSSARGNDHWRVLVIEGVVLAGAVLFWAAFALPDRTDARNRHQSG